MEIINLIFFIGGIELWVLAILMFRMYHQTRLISNIHLGCYFLFFGFFFPIIGIIPFTKENEEIIFILFYTQVLFYPLAFLFLNLFFDYSFHEKISRQTFLNGFIFGLFVGIYIMSRDGHLNWEGGQTLFGIFPNIIFSSIYGTIAFITTMGFIVYSIFRIIYKYRPKKQLKSNMYYALTTKFLIFMMIGPGIWAILQFVKRFFWIFNGIDYLWLFLNCFILYYIYHTKREFFYFLPGTLELCMIIHESGAPLCDYDFKTQKIILGTEERDSPQSFLLLRNLFYATTLVLNETFQQKECLQDIKFENAKIIYHASKSLRFVLIAKSTHSSYYQLLSQIANRLESKFDIEIRESITKGNMISEEFQRTIKSEFDKIY
jgi:hypothetical protein